MEYTFSITFSWPGSLYLTNQNVKRFPQISDEAGSLGRICDVIIEIVFYYYLKIFENASPSDHV